MSERDDCKKDDETETPSNVIKAEVGSLFLVSLSKNSIITFNYVIIQVV